MNRKWLLWLSAVMLVLGMGVLLYPAVSSAVNRQHGSYAIQQMQEQLDEMDSARMEAALKEARDYNESLQQPKQPEEDRYDRILDFGNGIMGYISIEKIDVLLPIYHGVSTEILEKGVGHLPGSAFPIGGEGNHTVLTGHTGLPSAKLFTDLAELSAGDRFRVTVGTNTCTYQIDQIRTVLPQETEELMPIAGEDYCTLVTCTPYGVNSHRLLVRGSRVEEAEEEAVPVMQTETEQEKGFDLRWLLPIPLLLLVPIWIRKRGKHG